MVTFRVFKQYIPATLAVLALVETLIFIASAYAAIYMRFYSGGAAMVEIVPGQFNVLVLTVVLGASLTSVGLYQRRTRLAIAGILVRLTLGFFTAIVALSFIYYLFPNIEMGRGVLALALIFSFSGMLIARVIFVAVTNQDVLKRRVLILGAGKRASVFNTLRRRVDQKGYYVVGFIHLNSDRTVAIIDETKLIADQAPLYEIAERYEIDEIVVALDDRRKQFPLDDLLACKLQGVDVVDLQTFFERETGTIKLDLLHPSHFIFSDGFKQSLVQDVVKRMFDIVSSSILLVMTCPIMLLAAVLIKLEDRGPIFFQQIRVGKGSEPYTVLKFRSMRVDAERDGKAQWATKNDRRITRVGDIMRKTRIDELPQIYNVLKGEMSFVGPRPERPEFATGLSEKIPYYRERHRVKPGITGWAQICYPYGASDKDSYEKLQYDLYYAKNHNVFLDLTILMQTAEVILFGKGR